MTDHDHTPFAVIFTSRRTAAGQSEYDRTAARMLELAAAQDGFLGFDSVRGPDGVGITISWWRDADSIRRWQQHPEHLAAQRNGQEHWYSEYSIRICRLVSERRWTLPADSE